MLMLPELIVIVTAFMVLFMDLFLPKKRHAILTPTVLIGLFTSLIALIYLGPTQGALLGGRFSMDGITWWFKIFFIISGFVVVTFSRDLLDGSVLKKEMGHPGEYYMVLLFTLAGMLFLTSSTDLLTLYISLELATIPLFLLTGWRRHNHFSGEAGLKYVVQGALSSALLLYGLGLLYGLTGNTSLFGIEKTLSMAPLSPSILFTIALIVAGIGFKLALVPFHMWAADIYEGAPTPITAYLSVASKGVGLVFMFQIFYRVFGYMLPHLTLFLAILAALTMTLGNLAAIVQQNIKRFMAFSSISQAGYLIMGFLYPSAEGTSAMLFYMLVYIASNLAVFGVIIAYSNETGLEQIKDYRGLSRTNPLVALAMMLALFSLAGIPPLSGFVGKFFLFSIASKAGLHWLVALAAINSTISLFYYLRIVRQMYIEAPLENFKGICISKTLGLAVLATSLGAVFLGVIPYFYHLIEKTTSL